LSGTPLSYKYSSQSIAGSCHRVIERASNRPQSDDKSAPDGTGFGATNLSDHHGLALRRHDFATPPKPGGTGRSMIAGHDPLLRTIDCRAFRGLWPLFYRISAQSWTSPWRDLIAINDSLHSRWDSVPSQRYSRICLSRVRRVLGEIRLLTISMSWIPNQIGSSRPTGPSTMIRWFTRP